MMQIFIFWFFFWDADEHFDWENIVVYDNWIRKIRKQNVIDLEKVSLKDIG